jgi:hypothetical protein
VIVEVLSDSTEAYDRGEKLRHESPPREPSRALYASPLAEPIADVSGIRGFHPLARREVGQR